MRAWWAQPLLSRGSCPKVLRSPISPPQVADDVLDLALAGDLADCLDCVLLGAVLNGQALAVLGVVQPHAIAVERLDITPGHRISCESVVPNLYFDDADTSSQKCRKR